MFVAVCNSIASYFCNISFVVRYFNLTQLFLLFLPSFLTVVDLRSNSSGRRGPAYPSLGAYHTPGQNPATSVLSAAATKAMAFASMNHTAGASNTPILQAEVVMK